VSGRGALAAAALVICAAEAAAEPPRIVNARVTTRSAAGGLRDAVRGVLAAGGGPHWLGYAVPVDGPHSMCCWESVDAIERTRRPGCRLEGKGGFMMGGRVEDAVDLEADTASVVMLRAESGRIGRVRAVSWSCALDAGGLPVTWLDDVRPADSVRLLAGLIEDAPGRHVMDGALLALAVHAEPSALDTLVATARRDPSSEVRGQALFWLSQKAGERAVGAIARAVDEDPESAVRQKAVFALSQLPKDEGVPRLLSLARGHRDPGVRKKAIFWLGQSGDPRALALFEEILRR
jgi:hypothetical protein